ncbi:hypothetical protein AcV7_001973 [Taiwanofungus camphoratus]|nr:hypothetical protein AcV7_001973 [Antrodia cinnamomea]
MHNCLKISEILTVIIEHAYSDPDSRPVIATRTLVALALTCKTFLEPALDRLWHEQQTLVPLVKTLPVDAWSEVEGDIVAQERKMDRGELIREKTMQRVVSITRTLVPQDWSRFDMYASRVKSLGFETRKIRVNRRTHTFDEGVYDHLIRDREAALLLPNVHRLMWTTSDIDANVLSYAQLFIGPCLKSLCLHFFNDLPQDSYSMVASLEKICPSSSLIDFEMLSVPFKRRSHLLTQLLHAPNSISFRRFWVFGLSKDDIVRLASLPRLRAVKLGMKHIYDDNFQFLAKACIHPMFPSLQVLEINVDSITACGALLKVMKSCSLRHLTVCSTRLESPEVLHEFLTNLYTHCSQESLQGIRIIDVPGDHVPRGDLGINGYALDPLFAFRNLRSVYFDCWCGHELDNATLVKLASSWPLLEVFSMGVNHGWSQISGWTFAGVAQLLRLCPNLRSLGMAIDVSQDDLRMASAADDHICSKRITMLDVGDSMIGDVTVTARSFAYLFPNLREIWARRPLWHESFKEGYGHKDVAKTFWEDVQKQVRVYADAAVELTSDVT